MTSALLCVSYQSDFSKIADPHREQVTNDFSHMGQPTSTGAELGWPTHIPLPVLPQL